MLDSTKLYLIKRPRRIKPMFLVVRPICDAKNQLVIWITQTGVMVHHNDEYDVYELDLNQLTAVEVK